jgi:trimethylamine:corrinoid methyltransferase-like protein
LLPALAGANLIYGLGMIEMGMTFDLIMEKAEAELGISK